jgi:hypothetical protein
MGSIGLSRSTCRYENELSTRLTCLYIVNQSKGKKKNQFSTSSNFASVSYVIGYMSVL